ncbi:MAG TPA: shikimate kinase [Candidatus Saccharimonadales bacterium]|nr:shikimate kinase [Candidatus Saccharimonadales bacterium]
MQIYVLFGLPGAGKTFVGKIFEESFGFSFYEGDADLTEEMKEAIVTKTPFTDEMRDIFFHNLIHNVKNKYKEKKKIVIAQTFIKEKYRIMLLEAIPEAKFLFIHADDAIREKRLMERVAYPLDLEYSRIMVHNFEKPTIKHRVIGNNENGSGAVKEEIKILLYNY